MNDIISVGAAIRAARKANRLSQAQLAELAGISERSVRDIEQGRGSAGFGAVVAVANVLGMHLGVA